MNERRKKLASILARIDQELTEAEAMMVEEEFTAEELLEVKKIRNGIQRMQISAAQEQLDSLPEK